MFQTDNEIHVKTPWLISKSYASMVAYQTKQKRITQMTWILTNKKTELFYYFDSEEEARDYIDSTISFIESTDWVLTDPEGQDWVV